MKCNDYTKRKENEQKHETRPFEKHNLLVNVGKKINCFELSQKKSQIVLKTTRKDNLCIPFVRIICLKFVEILKHKELLCEFFFIVAFVFIWESLDHSF